MKILSLSAGGALAAALAAASCSHASKPEPAAGSTAAETAAADAKSFGMVYAVLQHPRCLNCHPAGDAPLQGDDSHAHQQNIQRGPDGNGPPGLSCTACHGLSNKPAAYGANMPPGSSEGWRLPKASMKLVFEGMAPRALCEQLRDPQRNGGKDLAGLVHHVTEAPLVLWGWDPGVGRKPVPTPHAEFVAAFKAWADKGGPCPAQ